MPMPIVPAPMAPTLLIAMRASSQPGGAECKKQKSVNGGTAVGYWLLAFGRRSKRLLAVQAKSQKLRAKSALRFERERHLHAGDLDGVALVQVLLRAGRDI